MRPSSPTLYPTSADRVCHTSFTEKRLDLAGLAIGAGLLQQRGYPEMIARTVRGALVGHDHRMAGRVLAAVVTGSTAVTMTTDQVGTTAPLLEGIELQVELFEPGTKTPDAELTRQIAAEAARRGLVLLSCGSCGNVIRVLVPLTISDALLDEGLRILADAFAAVR